MIDISIQALVGVKRAARSKDRKIMVTSFASSKVTGNPTKVTWVFNKST
jgi:hypothetical protein